MIEKKGIVENEEDMETSVYRTSYPDHDLTALPITSVQAAETQYWTESSERVGYIEHVMNDGTIHSTFNEGHMKVEGETAYCVDINTGFKNGYKTRHDANTSMSAAQIEDVALSLEYVKQYRGSHSNLNANQGYLLEQCVVWQRLSEYLGWQCDNVRAAYSEISQDIQNEVYAGARAFVQANKGRYKCGGYIYTGEGQDLGQFWAELNVGNAKVKKTTANEIVTNGNTMYTIAGATFGISCLVGRWLRQKMQSCSLMAKKLPMIMNLQRTRKIWKCRLSLLSTAALLEESSL